VDFSGFPVQFIKICVNLSDSFEKTFLEQADPYILFMNLSSTVRVAACDRGVWTFTPRGQQIHAARALLRLPASTRAWNHVRLVWLTQLGERRLPSNRPCTLFNVGNGDQVRATSG
jgi:hypothetical protein